MYADPRDLFYAAHAAIAREDWRGLAEMCDPASLRLFQLQTLRALKPRNIRTVTVEEYLRQAPDMPRVVAEYHVSKIAEDVGPQSRMKDDFPTIGSIAELAGLPAVELFAAWLYGKSLPMQLDRALREHQISPRAAERVRQDMRAMPPSPPPLLLGVVPDGERVAHLLFRADRSNEPDSSIAEEEVRQLQQDVLDRKFVYVETVRRSAAGGWGLIAEWGMLGLGHNSLFFEPVDDSDEAAV